MKFKTRLSNSKVAIGRDYPEVLELINNHINTLVAKGKTDGNIHTVPVSTPLTAGSGMLVIAERLWADRESAEEYINWSTEQFKSHNLEPWDFIEIVEVE